MRTLATAAFLLSSGLLISGVALAQVGVSQPDTVAPGGPPQGPAGAVGDTNAGPPPPPARPRHMNARDKFNAANVTHDGKLTPEQAQAGMPNVARHFHEIDADNKGYVTLQDLRTWHASRKAQKAGAAPPGVPPQDGTGAPGPVNGPQVGPAPPSPPR